MNEWLLLIHALARIVHRGDTLAYSCETCQQRATPVVPIDFTCTNYDYRPRVRE